MIRLWIREDGEQPKAIARDATAAPGPGLIVDVDARNSDEARRIYATTLQTEPLEEQDPQGWIEWRRCRRLVKPLPLANLPEVNHV